jgi:hypothetical protein
MYAATDVVAGYSYNVCVSCENPDENVNTGTSNIITVTLPPLDCSATMTTP